jgi:hypothetical protein
MEKDLKKELIIIIEDYISEAVSLCKNLKKKYEVENLIIAWRQKKIPESGYIDSEDKISFLFHGVGCTFESDAFVIDLDFGFSGRCDGFDLWRIKRYINQNEKFKHSVFQEASILNEVFKELEISEKIVCPKLHPSKHLYYFSDSI